MTVSSAVNRVAFAGNGSTTAFAFPYYFLAAGDLAVALIDALGVITPLALTTDYTVSGTRAANGTYPSGGTVTALVAPPTGKTITILCSPPVSQPTHWVDYDPDPAAVKETAFDRVTLLIRRLYDLVARAITLPDGFAGTFNMKLPSAIPPNSVLATNATGDGWQIGAYAGVVGSPSVPLLVSGAIDPLPFAMFQTFFIAGNGGPVSASLSPANVTGIRVLLFCVAGGTVEFDNGGLMVRNGKYVMQDGSSSEYSWDGTNWRQVGQDNEL